MSKRTSIIIGAVLLLLAFGIVYSITTTKSEADCLRELVYCSYPEHLSGCPGDGINAWHNFRCHVCLGDGCPASPTHRCVDLGYTCMYDDPV